MIVTLPCADSEDAAAAGRRALDIPRHVAAALGRYAVEAIQRGHYAVGNGKVDWRRHVRAACSAKVNVPPGAPLPACGLPTYPETRIRVANETTLQASRRFVDQGMRPLALNFADGIHPGGGFLDGARAQEEARCRSSALCRTLVDDPMYEAHRWRPLPDSTEWAVFFDGEFSEIAFAITDWSPERRYLGPFRDVFAKEDTI
jgi:hypothetical protein